MAKNHKQEIVLFHSVLGLRPGVKKAAEKLQNQEYIVHTPNLYDEGVIFDDYEKADAYLQSIGSYPELLKRTRESVVDLPDELIYAGFSNGGASAEYLALTRPKARAAILFSGALPLEMLLEIGGDQQQNWPKSVPVQLHYTKNDPFRNQEWIDSFRESVSSSQAQLNFYEYPGEGHLFTDDSLPNEYNEESSKQLWERVFKFLNQI